MNAERDERITQVFDGLAAPISPQLEARAAALLADCRPASAPRRQRLALAIALSAAAIVALGFVPFPAGDAPGAWARALAKMKQPANVHVTTRYWFPSAETAWEWRESEDLLEDWVSGNGFFRFEVRNRTTGKLYSLHMEADDRKIVYQLERENQWELSEYDLPPRWADPALAATYLPSRARLLVDLRELSSNAEITIKEYRKRSLWHGARNVVEVNGRFRKSSSRTFLYGNWRDFAAGDKLRIYAEIDAATDHLLLVEEYGRQNSRHSRGWQPIAKTTFEWPDRIPADLLTFRPPTGTRIVQHTVWKGRTDKTIATASADGWKFALHALERNTQGDLCATVSAVPTTGREITLYDVKFLLAGQAEDDAGGKYHFVIEESLGDRGYHIVGLRRNASPPARPAAKRISLTVWRYDQPKARVTFTDLPLPPPLTRDNLLIQSVRTYRVGD